MLVRYSESISATDPWLARQWHHARNAPLSPTRVKKSSTALLWWRDEFGHVWQASPASRHECEPCPVCVRTRVIAGLNDLSVTHPQAAEQWHPTKNRGLTPDRVRAGSSKVAWWLGECGHEWESTIAVHTHHPVCPFCSNRKVLEGFNDLASTDPELAAHWHPTRNGTFTPAQVGPQTGRRVWWRCTEGHSFQARVSEMVRGKQCPECWRAGR